MLRFDMTLGVLADLIYFFTHLHNLICALPLSIWILVIYLFHALPNVIIPHPIH